MGLAHLSLVIWGIWTRLSSSFFFSSPHLLSVHFSLSFWWRTNSEMNKTEGGEKKKLVFCKYFVNGDIEKKKTVKEKFESNFLRECKHQYIKNQNT